MFIIVIIFIIIFLSFYLFSISVDTLLQIHAIHNLLEIDSSIGAEERTSFDVDLNKLEAKYLEKYVNLVKTFQLEQTKWAEKIDTIRSKLKANEYQWWMNALRNEPHDSDQLLRRIQDEIKPVYGNMKNNVQNGLSDVWAK